MSIVNDSKSSLRSSSPESSTPTSSSYTEESTPTSSKRTLNPKSIISYYDYTRASSNGSLNLVDIFLQRKNSIQRKRAGGGNQQQQQQHCELSRKCPVQAEKQPCLCEGDSKYDIESLSSVSFDVVESEEESKTCKNETSCESFLVETTRTKYFRVIQEHDRRGDCDNRTCRICLQRKIQAEKKLCRPPKTETVCSYCLGDSRTSWIGPDVDRGRQQKTGRLYSKSDPQSKNDDQWNTDSGGTGDEGTDQRKFIKFSSYSKPRENVTNKEASGAIITELSDRYSTTVTESEMEDSEREDNSYTSESISGTQNNKLNLDDPPAKRQHSVDSIQTDSQYSRKSSESNIDSYTESISSGSEFDYQQVTNPTISQSKYEKDSSSIHHFGVEFNTNNVTESIPKNDSKVHKRNKSVHFGLKSDLSTEGKIVAAAEFNIINNSESEKPFGKYVESQPFNSISSLRIKLEIRSSSEKLLQNYSCNTKKSKLFDESKSENAIYTDGEDSPMEQDSLDDDNDRNVRFRHSEDDTDIDESLSDIEIPCPCPSTVSLQNEQVKFTPMRLEIVDVAPPIMKTQMEYIRKPFYSLLLDVINYQPKFVTIDDVTPTQSRYRNELVPKCASGCCHLEIALTDTDSSTDLQDQFEFSTKQSSIVQNNENFIPRTTFETELATGILAAVMEEIHLTQRFNRIEALNDATRPYHFEISLENIAKAIRTLDNDNGADITSLNDDSLSPLLRLEITSDLSEILKQRVQLNVDNSIDFSIEDSSSWALSSISDIIPKNNKQSSILLKTIDYTKRSTENESETGCVVSLEITAGSIDTLKQIFPKSVPITNKAIIKAVEINIISDTSHYAGKMGKPISAPFIKIFEVGSECVSEDTSKVLIAKPPTLPPIFKDKEWLKRELSDMETSDGYSTKTNQIINRTEKWYRKSESKTDIEDCTNKNQIQEDVTQNEYVSISSDELTLDITYPELLAILTKKRTKEKATKSDQQLHDEQKVIFTKSDIKMILDLAKNRRRVYPSGCRIEYQASDHSDGLTLDVTYQELLSILTKQELKENVVNSGDQETKAKIKIKDEQMVFDDETQSSKCLCLCNSSICKCISSDGGSVSLRMEVLHTILKEQGIGGKFSQAVASTESDTLTSNLLNSPTNSDGLTLSSQLSRFCQVQKQDSNQIENESFTYSDIKSLLDLAKNRNHLSSSDFQFEYADRLPSYQKLLSMLIKQDVEEKDKSDKELARDSDKEKNEKLEMKKMVNEKSGTKTSSNFNQFISEVIGQEMLSILEKQKDGQLNQKNSLLCCRGCDFDIISVNSDVTSYDLSSSGVEPLTRKQQVSETEAIAEEKTSEQKWPVPFPKFTRVSNKTKGKLRNEISKDVKSKIPVSKVSLLRSPNIDLIKETPITVETQTTQNKYQSVIPAVETQTISYVSRNCQSTKCTTSKNMSSKFEMKCNNECDSQINRKTLKKDNLNTEIHSKKEEIELKKRKSKIPKAVATTNILDKHHNALSTNKDTASSSSDMKDNISIAKKSVQFHSRDLQSNRMPSVQQLLSIAMNYKKIMSGNDHVRADHKSSKNWIKVCPECEVEIRSVDYDSQTSDGDLLSLLNAGQDKNILYKNTKSSTSKNDVESIPVNSDSRSCTLCEEKRSSSSKNQKQDVSDSQSCDIYFMEWINRLKKKQEELKVPQPRISCTCREEWLSLRNTIDQTSCHGSVESRLSLSKNKMDEPSCECRKEWSSLSNNKMDEPSCECRKEWSSLSNNKMDEPSCECRKEWSSLSNNKMDEPSCECREKWSSLSKSSKLESKCAVEYALDDSDSATCDQCLAEWLSNRAANNRRETSEIRLQTSSSDKTTKTKTEGVSDTKVFDDSVSNSLELSDIDATVSEPLPIEVSAITDVLDRKLSDIANLSLDDKSYIPSLSDDEENCQCVEKFEELIEDGSISSSFSDNECCSCIVDDYDAYFFSRTPWGSTLDQATVGILRAISIFKNCEQTSLATSEPINNASNNDESGISSAIKGSIDFLRQQFLGPTISESVITLFEGINYLTSTAYGIDAPYEAHSCCPKRRKYYGNQTEG